MRNNKPYKILQVPVTDFENLILKLKKENILPEDIIYGNNLPKNNTINTSTKIITPLIMVIFGILGFVVTFIFQVWTSINYPLQIGGKPNLAYLSYLPSAFEIGILLSVIAGFISFMMEIRSSKRSIKYFENKLDPNFIGLIFSPQNWNNLSIKKEVSDYEID